MDSVTQAFKPESAALRKPSLHSVGSHNRRRTRSTSKLLTFTRTFPFIFLLFHLLVRTSSAALLDRIRLAKHAEIDANGNTVADQSIPRADQHVGSLAEHGDPLNHQDKDLTTSSATRFHATVTAFASSTASDASPTSTQPASASLASFPRPFDTPLGNNFTTQSCPQFFDKFLNDQSFINCLPLSLFLQTSQAFFQDESDPSTLDAVLDASCSVVSASCNSIMQSYAMQLKDTANCGNELSQQNQQVTRAYNGLISYLPTYQAGCLKADPNKVSSASESEYCFTNAANDVNNAADLALYYIPLAMPLPGGSKPSCSSCTQQLMNIFATAAQNLSTPLGVDYASTAQIVNEGCGPTFSNASVKPIAGTGSSASASATVGAAGWALMLLAGLFTYYL